MSGGKRNIFRSPSLLLGGSALVLGLTGILTIASSRYSVVAHPDPLLFKQMLFLIAGLTMLFASSSVPFRVYRRYAPWLGACGVLLLLLLPICGVRIHGMRGWLRFGAVSLQPSELMKAPFLLMLSVLLARRGVPELRRFGTGALWTLLWIIPVVLQPDFGTATIYFGTFLLLYFVVGGSWALLALPPVFGLGAAAWFIRSHPYAWKRLCGFIDPGRDPLGSGWHALQFELAIARGHLFGAKLGGAVWSNNYLPFSYNDSAFATLLETLGLTGGLLAGAALALLASSLWRLGRREALPGENRVFIMGAMVLIVFQSLIHVSVNLCLLPTTGLTLPFVSYGGSSLLGCFWLLGMALSAGRECETDNETVSAPENKGGK